MKFSQIPFILLLGAASASAESFESVPAGPFTRMKTSVGRWSAEEVNARIQAGHGKSGNQCLRLCGEGERTVLLKLSEAAEKGSVLALQAERWTKRDPFEFRIDAKDAGDWQEIHQADNDVKAGGFLTEIRPVLPEGAQQVRFRATAPADAGMVEARQHHRAGEGPRMAAVFQRSRCRHCVGGRHAGVPAQFRAADGKPWSTLISSKDRGETWQTGTGVKSDTTEAQLIQLADGSIMINCRDNRGGSRTVAVTKDLGKTWEPHPTDRSSLREPVCMASLLRWNHPNHGDLIFFSNPDSSRGRYNMTLKLSRDQALTWPEADARLYDSHSCFGYSCLAIAGPDHIGALYEGKSSMLYLRLPLDEWFR